MRRGKNKIKTIAGKEKKEVVCRSRSKLFTPARKKGTGKKKRVKTGNTDQEKAQNRRRQ